MPLRRVPFRRALVFVIALAAVHFCQMYGSPAGSGLIYAGEVAQGETGQSSASLTAVENNKMPRTAYESIATKNLFNPVRREKWEEKKKAEPPKRSAAPVKQIQKRQTLLLEGTMIFGTHHTALIKDKARSREGVKSVVVGDTIGGYTVVTIEEGRVLLKDRKGADEVLTFSSPEDSVERRHVKTDAALHEPPQRMETSQPRKKVRRPPVPARRRPPVNRRPPVTNQ